MGMFSGRGGPFSGRIAFAGVAETTGLVANRFQAPTAFSPIAASFTSRRSHYASADGAISQIQTLDVGWAITSAAGPANADARTIKRFIEYPAGTFTPVTWSGQPTVAIAPGAVVKSDPVAGLAIPAGAEFFERTVNAGASVTNWPVMELPASSQALGVPDGNVVTDQGNSGTINPTSTVNTMGAVAMAGKIASANARSFVVIGDSIVFGEGDVSNVGPKRGSGWVARMLDKTGTPYLKIAKPGQAAYEFVGALARVQDLLAQLTFSDLIQEQGINDVRLGRSQAQILADHQTIYALAAGKRINQTTLTPRASSTNAYADVAGQSPRTDGNMANLAAINDAIRLKPANVSAVIDVADAAMSARNSGVWSGPFPPTTDGTHPTSGKAAAMATATSLPA